jgi:hypothetical protein
LFTRAVIFVESLFDPCAARKVCRKNYDKPGCLEKGPGEDEGYASGYYEMFDPTGKCVFENALQERNQDWRWLSLGIMQNLEPPYDYWHSSKRHDGLTGPLYDILTKSALRNMSLDDAKKCNPKFNPFNVRDSVCLGTLKLSRALAEAREWIITRRDKLNRANPENDKDLVMYIATHIYTSTFFSFKRSHLHPRCRSSMPNSNCWIQGYLDSWIVNASYCVKSSGGKLPQLCASVGVLKNNPPKVCYGYTNFIDYVKDCEVPFLNRPVDTGAKVLEAYHKLRKKCRQ